MTIAMNEDADEISTSPICLKDGKYRNILNNLRTLNDFKNFKLLIELNIYQLSII